jgi:hypothetical protein
MSTETGIHDVEYGPNPPGTTYEHSDIDAAFGYKFAIWLAVAMILSAAIVYGTFRVFDAQTSTADAAVQKYPLAAGRPKEPPLPRLQTQPFKDLYQLRLGEDGKLDSYAWVDKEVGVTRIPIDRAMEILIEKGLPARTGGTDGKSLVVSDSSSGRTTVSR